jgi:hypothetical protein
MPSSYSTNLALELMATGDKAGLWGDITNTNLGTLIEQAISGYVTQAITDGADTVITIPNGATGVARNMFLELTGALSAARNLIVPANKKLYFIYNNTTGGSGYAVTVKVSGQTGVSVPNGAKMLLVCDGTDVELATTYMRMTGMTSSGAVGIGTTTPLFSLDVSGTGADTFIRQINTGTSASDDSIVSVQTSSTGTTATVSGLYFGDGDNQTIGRLWYQHADDSMAFYTNSTEKLRVTSAGYVGIGTTSPNWKLDVQGTGTDTFFRQLNTGTSASDDSIISIQTSSTGATATLSGIYFGDGDSQTVGRIWYSHSSNNLQFWTSDTYQGAIDTDGNWLVGYSGSNGAYKLQVNSQIFATNATIATSDGRYKENVQALEAGLSVIEKLRPVTFTWRPHTVHNFPVGTTDIGFIAQEVKTALPFWYGGAVVKENSIGDEPFLGMADSKLIPILVRAVQELAARVSELEGAR